MALKSDPPPTLFDLWQMATPLPDVYAQYARDHGHAVGVMGAIVSILHLINSQINIIAKYERNPDSLFEELKRDGANLLAQRQSIEPNFRNKLVRKLNSGKSIAIGYRLYSPQRRDSKYVWDGRLRANYFDLQNGGYSGLQKQFEQIRILDSTICSDYWLNKFERIRAGKTGRTKIEEISETIDRLAEDDPNFLDPANHKRAVGKVQDSFSMQVANNELSQAPSISTIEAAVRSKRKALTQR